MVTVWDNQLPYAHRFILIYESIILRLRDKRPNNRISYLLRLYLILSSLAVLRVVQNNAEPKLVRQLFCTREGLCGLPLCRRLPSAVGGPLSSAAVGLIVGRLLVRTRYGDCEASGMAVAERKRTSARGTLTGLLLSQGLWWRRMSAPNISGGEMWRGDEIQTVPQSVEMIMARARKSIVAPRTCSRLPTHLGCAGRKAQGQSFAAATSWRRQ